MLGGMLHVYVFRLASSSLIVIVPAAGAGTLFAKRTVLRRRKTYRPRIFVKLPSSRESEIVLTRTRGRLEVVDNKNAGSMHSFRVALLASMLRNESGDGTERSRRERPCEQRFGSESHTRKNCETRLSALGAKRTVLRITGGGLVSR